MQGRSRYTSAAAPERIKMKLVSWNVNGLRACTSKGFADSMKGLDPDILCLQETKCQPDQAQTGLEGYHEYFNSAEKKGYSGTGLLTKEEPLNVSFGIGIPEHDTEGRVITAEYEQFFLVCVYTPNSQRGLTRLDYRMQWEDAFLSYVKELDRTKPVIFCGDLNVAHKEIDLKNPKSNTKNAGFTPEERSKMDAVTENGFTDSFRYFYPDTKDIYSWWSYMFKARENNAGWRIDYFMVSDRLRDRLKDAKIHTDIMGSDHCPVELDLEF